MDEWGTRFHRYNYTGVLSAHAGPRQVASKTVNLPIEFQTQKPFLSIHFSARLFWMDFVRLMKPFKGLSGTRP